MITRLRLKNWRSLRDVTIEDLTPITVFIGANSSGKTNILDALYFTRDTLNENIMQAVYERGAGSKIHTLGIPSDDPTVIEFTCSLPGFELITRVTQMLFQTDGLEFGVKQTLLENGKTVIADPSYEHLPRVNDFEKTDTNWGDTYLDKLDHAESLLKSLRNFVTSRWQLLNENFMPYLSLSPTQIGDIYTIDECADNLVFMLDFMQKTRPDLFNQLQYDLQYLLGHVKQIRAERDDREARILVHEAGYPDEEAPTISSGTARVLAMITAYYVLDMRNSSQAGLVVIEEPDTALNPGLLQNFVEQLREYVDRPEPRQFILTTHNPAFLNYFRPEEVRIVSRDENGYTSVNRVPDYVKDIWLDEHGLGEVWLTNAFGGVTE